MSTLRYFNTHYIKAKKVKLAAGSRCELCGYEERIEGLEIHALIDEERADGIPISGLEGHILVLCTRCHHDLHRFGAPVAEQENLVRRRDLDTRRIIREILSYLPRQYAPPDSDMEEVYRDACSSRFRFGT